MMIPVGQLEVIVYVAVQCPKHPAGWYLRRRPVMECPYYISVKYADRQAYEDYIDVWARRTPAEKTNRPYHAFIQQVEEIRADRGYIPEKGARNPIRVYRDTKLLHDGHHRAAIMCALFGPDYQVPVTELATYDQFPTDLDQCANPCGE